MYTYFITAPMYFQGYFEDQDNGKSYMEFWEGILDIFRTRFVSLEFSDWSAEFTWMIPSSLLAASSSLLLMYGPRYSEHNIYRNHDYDERSYYATLNYVY